MYHKHVQKWKDYFKKQGITLKIKMGVETFDDTFRREVFDKGMEGVMPEEIAGVADEVCLLFGINKIVFLLRHPKSYLAILHPLLPPAPSAVVSFP